MYEYLRGELVRTGDNEAVVEVAGVGYLLAVSAYTRRALPSCGEQVRLPVHLVHREDSQQLIGFSSEQERTVFRQLLALSGIGPKQALKILSGLDLGDFVAAVAVGDVTRLCRIPGLGKKTAEKLVFELKDKLGTLPAAGPLPRESDTSQEAVAALEALGFSHLAARSAVLEAVREQGEDTALENLIKGALRHV